MSYFDTYLAKEIPPGTVILEPGETPHLIFFLKKGYVKHYVTFKEGKELVIHIYEKGSIFPLMWGINDEVPNYFLETMTNCEIAYIPKKIYLEELKKNNEMLFELTTNLLAGLSGMSKRVEILAHGKANEVIKSTLDYLSRHFGKRLRLTHEELAALTGLTRERVSIEMKKLKDTGEVAYKRKKIRLHK